MTTEKNHTLKDNPLYIVNDVNKTWAEEATEYMDDEDFGAVLAMVTRIIANDIPEPQKVGQVCARLEAYAIKFRMQFTAYMSYKKGTTEANMKKNHYKELYTGIDRLVDSLKYLVK